MSFKLRCHSEFRDAPRFIRGQASLAKNLEGDSSRVSLNLKKAALNLAQKFILKCNQTALVEFFDGRESPNYCKPTRHRNFAQSMGASGAGLADKIGIKRARARPGKMPESRSGVSHSP